MRWIITFSDLVTLMLVFFVMLFSVSSTDTKKFKAVFSPMSRREINIKEVKISKPEQVFNIEYEEEPFIDDALDYIYKLLELRIEENPQLKDLVLKNEGKYLKLSLPSDIVFETNSVALKESGKLSFLEVLQQLVNLKNPISFIAYSDPRPIVTGGYQNNEKLSMGRAMAVANLLKKLGYRGEPTVLLGGTRAFEKVDPTLPLEQRYELSRKVDIIVYTVQLNQEELFLLPHV